MKNKNGFTLIELLAVIVVLAIILVIAVTSVSNLQNESKDSLFVKQAMLAVDSAKQESIFYSGNEEALIVYPIERIMGENNRSTYGNPMSGYVYALCKNYGDCEYFVFLVDEKTGKYVGVPSNTVGSLYGMIKADALADLKARKYEPGYYTEKDMSEFLDKLSGGIGISVSSDGKEVTDVLVTKINGKTDLVNSSNINYAYSSYINIKYGFKTDGTTNTCAEKSIILNDDGEYVTILTSRKYTNSSGFLDRTKIGYRLFLNNNPKANIRYLNINDLKSLTKTESLEASNNLFLQKGEAEGFKITLPVYFTNLLYTKNMQDSDGYVFVADNKICSDDITKKNQKNCPVIKLSEDPSENDEYEIDHQDSYYRPLVLEIPKEDINDFICDY